MATASRFRPDPRASGAELPALRVRRGLALLGVLATTLASGAAPAGAAPIPADKTVDAKVMISWPTTWSGMPPSDAKHYKSTTIESGVGLRLFMVKDQLLVSVPSFTTQDVMAGGVSTRNAAFIAGRGSYRCKKATLKSPGKATGDAVNFCASYRPGANGFQFRFKFESESYLSARVFYEYAMQFDVDAQKCQVELLSGSMRTTVKAANYDVTQSASARPKSTSCKLLPGKQTY